MADSHRLPLVACLLALGALLVSRAPPKDYALCSPDRKIYTVDTAHPNVECIVVSNTTIADLGDLGGSTLLPFPRSLTGRSGYQGALGRAPESRQLSDPMAARLLAALAPHFIRGTRQHRCSGPYR